MNEQVKAPSSAAVTTVKTEEDRCIELGYLLLENTPVRLRSPSRLLQVDVDAETGSPCRHRPNVWYSVQFTSAPLWKKDSDPCPTCDLTFVSQGKHLCLSWETVGPAVVAAALPPETVSSSSVSSSSPMPVPRSAVSSSANVVVEKGPKVEDHSCGCQTRSDGAVLFDVLRTLQSDILIAECRVLFLDESLQTAEIYVTLSFPRLSLQNHTGVRSILGTRTSKPLSNKWQLLLTLVRSDWDELDRIVTSLQDESLTNGRRAPRRKSRVSVFPSRLTMEELYRRIQGSPFDEESRQKRLEQKLAAQYEGAKILTRLPSDIIERNVAPFLDARALDHLRRTCSYYHGLLEGVVPGMKLGLFQHQISSLVWMRERERHEVWEADCLDDIKNNMRRVAPDGDLHRSVTGGHTVRLCPRNGRVEDGLRVDTLTGREFQPKAIPEEVAPRRHVCRGGLLVDEPGLGKTITVLSLVLQTAGLSTESSIENDDEKEASGTDDKALFDSYWRECVPSNFQQEDLYRILNQVAKRGPKGSFPVDALRKHIGNDTYGFNFDLFIKELECTIRDSHVSKDQDAESSTPPSSLVHIMHDVVGAYKSRMLASAKKSFSNPRSKPNSNLASLIEESKRLRFVKSLIPSRGTLIVIPPVLMDHWESQIDMHINTRYLSIDKIPFVFTFGGDGISLEKAVDLINMGKYKPIVFLDRGGTKSLPSPEFLARFLIVITTTNRFSQEWKNGSFQGEVERCTNSTPERLFESGLDRSSGEACSLLKIHWLRMIIDEGHSMGRGSLSSSIQFASWISSERRWAMTGTPTREGPTALSQVRNLMKFLQHDFFTPRCDGETVWTKYISRPWKDGRKKFSRDDDSNCIASVANLSQASGGLASFFRMRSLLKLLMKRHTKADIVELAPPIYRESFVSMSHVEVVTYNSLVSAMQSNLLLTSMKKDAQQDSLLHRSQARFAREALANLRRVCIGGARVVPTLTEKLRQETEFLLSFYGLSPEKAGRIKKFLNSAQSEKLTPCDCCGFELPVLLLLPCCGGMVCSECMDGQGSVQYDNDGAAKWMHKRIDDKKRKQRKSRKYYKKDCIMCEEPFDVDNFQLLQPGFLFLWKETITGTQTTNGEIPMRIEPLQLSLETASNSSDRHLEDGTIPPNANGERMAIVRPPAARRRVKKRNDGHECEYDFHAVDGKCIHCLEEHDSCNLLETSRCRVCWRQRLECPDEETKSSYLVKKCLSLVQGSQPLVHTFEKLDEGRRPIKIIVFSQFRKALDMVGSRLLLRFGSACVSEYWGRYRTQELHKFTNDSDCFCMLLSKDGSEGLDLSFVTHIFFLEEIWDKSLAEQAVARAWRMGARGAVEVETIIARDSVEESMRAFEAGQLTDARDAIEDESLSTSKQKDRQQRKTHALLKSLRYVTDYHQFRKNAPKRPPPKPSDALLQQPPSPKRQRVTFEE